MCLTITTAVAAAVFGFCSTVQFFSEVLCVMPGAHK